MFAMQRCRSGAGVSEAAFDDRGEKAAIGGGARRGNWAAASAEVCGIDALCGGDALAGELDWGGTYCAKVESAVDPRSRRTGWQDRHPGGLPCEKFCARI